MAIIATGSKTIIDLSDGKSLSAYLGANQPRTQINDVNENTYSPDWTTTSGRLIITPVVYANQAPIELTDSNLTITWKRKEGSGTETDLITGESVSGNKLTVVLNMMASIASKQLTYLAYVAYRDPDNGLTINTMVDISFSLLTTGENSKSVWVSGEQVFKYDSAGNVSPEQITLTANLQHVTASQWQYRNSSGTWVDYPTTSDNANTTGSTLIVKPTHDIWVDEVAAIRITTSDATITDSTSIYKVQDGGQGTAGEDASIAFLSNENITFAANKDGQVSGMQAVCNVVAYTGTTKVTPAVGTLSGMPVGMTITAGSASNNEIPLTITITDGATLGGSDPQNGVVSVPVTSPVATTLQIQWSKVNTGATGENGEDGADAIIFSVYAPNGTTFQNQEGTLTLLTQKYDGSTEIATGATYQWAKYASGSWADISGATSDSYTVSGSDVANIGSYRCTMTYKSKSYVDVITLIDKTDNYQADIDSTAGDVFKNTVGTTCLICRLWQNGTEVDPQKSTIYSTTAPSSPVEGDYYYQIQASGATTKLMRHNGSAWVDVTSDATYGHTKTYKWYRRDKDGNPLDSGAVFATGKVIYVDGDDVDTKTVFVCEVE